jgi:hypothetical protein
MKLTAAQTKALNLVAAGNVAYGLVATDGAFETAADAKTCADLGRDKIHRTAAQGLVKKGLAEIVTTDQAASYTDAYGTTYTYFVQTMRLTDAGAALAA